MARGGAAQRARRRSTAPGRWPTRSSAEKPATPSSCTWPCAARASASRACSTGWDSGCASPTMSPLAIEAGEPVAQIKRGLRMPGRAADRLIADARRSGPDKLRRRDRGDRRPRAGLPRRRLRGRGRGHLRAARVAAHRRLSRLRRMDDDDDRGYRRRQHEQGEQPRHPDRPIPGPRLLTVPRGRCSGAAMTGRRTGAAARSVRSWSRSASRLVASRLGSAVGRSRSAAIRVELRGQLIAFGHRRWRASSAWSRSARSGRARERPRPSPDEPPANPCGLLALTQRGQPLAFGTLAFVLGRCLLARLVLALFEHRLELFHRGVAAAQGGAKLDL